MFHAAAQRRDVGVFVAPLRRRVKHLRLNYQFLHGSMTEAVVAPTFDAINLSTSSSINSPLTTHAFSASTSPVLLTLAGSRKIFQGEPQFRLSPVNFRYA